MTAPGGSPARHGGALGAAAPLCTCCRPRPCSAPLSSRPARALDAAPAVALCYTDALFVALLLIDRGPAVTG